MYIYKFHVKIENNTSLKFLLFIIELIYMCTQIIIIISKSIEYYIYYNILVSIINSVNFTDIPKFYLWIACGREPLFAPLVLNEFSGMIIGIIVADLGL